jgi:hypothetical protein
MAIKEKFPILDSSIIFETYNLLNDAELTFKLLELAFPQNVASTSKPYFEKMMA